MDALLARIGQAHDGVINWRVLRAAGVASEPAIDARDRRGPARRDHAGVELGAMAAGIRVAGVSEGQVLRYVRKLPGRGGVGTYCRDSVVHVDVGPRREWHQGCGSRKRIAKRKKTRNWNRA